MTGTRRLGELRLGIQEGEQNSVMREVGEGYEFSFGCLHRKCLEDLKKALLRRVLAI